VISWSSILAGFVKLANLVMGYLGNKQLMDAGEAKAVARLSAEERERVNEANRRAIAARDADSLPDSAFRD
jgi:hypothetical protein